VTRFLVLVTLALQACSPSLDDAEECGLTEVQLRQAIDEVSEMNPYTGKRVGQCELIVDDGDTVSVITPETQRRVDDMVAQEKAQQK
jgi:hypothetical protein